MMPKHSRSLTFVKSVNLAIRYAATSGGIVRPRWTVDSIAAVISMRIKKNVAIVSLCGHVPAASVNVMGSALAASRRIAVGNAQLDTATPDKTTYDHDLLLNEVVKKPAGAGWLFGDGWFSVEWKVAC